MNGTLAHHLHSLLLRVKLFFTHCLISDGKLSPGSRASRMSALGVTRELNDFGVLQPEHLLEPLSDRQEDLLPLFSRTSLTVPVARDGLSHAPGPDANSVERLSHVDDHTHYFVVALVFERLADSGELGMQPQLVDGHVLLVPE